MTRAVVGVLLLQLCSFASLAAAEACSVEGDVRLVRRDGGSGNEGRVEVCIDEEWGTVCDHNWGAADAEVVCRQLGLTAPTAYSDALYRYGGGSGPIHYAGFHCAGNETHLVNCSVDQRAADFEITNCEHHEDAGVACLTAPCNENEVRLNEEVVQVCHDEQWGLVCDHEDSWNPADANVVCNQARLPSGAPRAAYRRLIFYDAPVILNDVNCTGLEDSLADCSENGYGDFTSECTNISVAQCETPQACSDPGGIRLTQFNTDTIGRLEVCSGGRWGSVCGNGVTDHNIANVACRELGHAASGSVFVEFDTGGILQIVVPIAWTNMMCTGAEDSLSQCSFDGVDGDPTCTHADDIILVCTSRLCNENDIRLVDGQTPDDGRVEICIHGLWGTVCDDRWDTRDATVVCRQLGYSGASYPLLGHGSNDPLNFHFDNVECIGNESTLSECAHLGFGINDCLEGAEEAGVVCTNSTCEHGTVHLVDSDDVSRGRVEYCYEGSWYSVCDSGWSEEDARVVCETLGYDTSFLVPVISNFGRGTRPILPKAIECTVDDGTLSGCATTDLDISQCQHEAGVICVAACFTLRFTDCTVCGSRVGCDVVSGDRSICNCYSDCYEYGDCCPDVSHVDNCIIPECETGEIRLVGAGITNSTGRLEFCANGMWGRVCTYFGYWDPDNINAKVVCRQLGFSEDGAYVIDDASIFGESELSAVVGEVHCLGTEPELVECSHRTFGDHFCGRLSSESVPDLAISCYDEGTSCEGGDVRLRDGTDPSNGRVEICQHRTWGAVCSDEWDDNAARVVCGQLLYDPEDARAMEGFGKDERIPVFLDKVACTGAETHLNRCTNAVPTGECNAVGVTCGKSSSPSRCADEAGTPPDTQNIVTDKERFGVCGAYSREAMVCADVIRLGVDFVYISNSRGSQSDITTLLNDKIKNVENLFAIHDDECVKMVFTVLCKYYLPPCGNITLSLPPFSLCQEECAYVQSKCEATWTTASLAFSDDTDQFIDCADTSKLLFPLPNCCTGAGIELPTGVTTGSGKTPEPTVVQEQRSTGSGGAAAGIAGGVVVAILLGVIAVVAAVLLVIVYKNRRRKKQMQRMQMDILAIPGSSQPILNSIESHTNEAATGFSRDMEPEDKNQQFDPSIAEPNPYSVPLQSNTTSGSSLHVYENRPRVPSQYLRLLTLGKFVVKGDDITLLDAIGEGEFGVVYRAKLGSHGKPSREVAVKTLKGAFDQTEVDKFVEESLKMSRFKHSHVMGLTGVCLDAGSAPFIIMPYMANGSLLKYLKKERKNIVLSNDEDEDEVKAVCKRLTAMCSQIASGMEYLAAEKYVHRDLAARNCMIDTHFLIKITDFGLSEDVFRRNYFRQGSSGEVVKLPVKWMSPESLSDGHFSEKSDVWSYGVTMWEIFSGGKAPFPGTDPLTLMQRLEEGERMHKPYNAACTDEIYTIMTKCWEMAPDDRPTFKEIYSNISKYIERMAGYLEMGFNPFAAGERANTAVGGEKEKEKESEGECGVAIQVIPASVPLDGAHTNFTDNTD